MDSEERNPAYLLHMRDAVRAARSYVKGVSFKKFTENTLIRDAVTRQLEILGEAAKRVSPAFQKKHPDIPWKKIAGMRDKLIHDYHDVNTLVVWETATEDLPELQKELEQITEKLS